MFSKLPKSRNLRPSCVEKNAEIAKRMSKVNSAEKRSNGLAERSARASTGGTLLATTTGPSRCAAGRRARHRGHRVVDGRPLRVELGDNPPKPKDDDPIGDLEDVRHVVADEDHRDSFVAD